MNKTNHCFLVGNVGIDPVERSKSEKSGSVVGFSVAENVQSFDKSSNSYKTSHTNWFQVTTFGSMAERVIKNIKKGDRVAVQGRMKISKYTNKSGEEKTSFEILADEVALWKTLSSSTPATNSPPDFDAEDLPF
jgi:single-strand DNA-binding protein